MYYTYVLESEVDDNHYIGCTSDLRKRFEEHKSGKVKATSSRLPLRLVYYEACTSKVKAYKREHYFKTGFGRRFLVSRI